jgi:two-component system C4-dicarboxylate transport sensor histidine kinase DctB
MKMMLAKLMPFIRIKSLHLLIISFLFVVISFPFYEEMKNRINSSALIINMYKSSLESSIYQYKFLPFILSQNQKIVDIVSGDLNATESGFFLQRIKYATNVATVFVQDRSGRAIASSNWDSKDSYIGKNYGFRPYFKEAMAGRLGQFYGVGITSLTPGYFISYGLRSGEAIIGAITIEINLSSLEDVWGMGPDEILVHDRNNIIFLSSNKAWKNKTFGDISQIAIDKVDSEKQFVRHLLSPIDLKPCYRVSDMTFYSSSMFGCLLPGKFSIEENIITYGWTILSLQSTNYYYALAGLALLLVALVYAIVIFSFRNFRNKYNRSILKLRTQLVENSKLASIGQMATELAHEFNQPLSAIYMLLDTSRLMLARKLYPQVDDNLALVASHIERMTQQISELKSFASRHRIASGNANVVLVANSSIRLCQATLKKNNVPLDFHASHNVIEVPCNEIGLGQIFSNLITNALEAMATQEKKRLEIRISKEKSRTNGPDKVVVTIRDNGSGISDPSQIFESYFSTKQQGTGLGLAIVKGIVEHSGGSIIARNHPDGGAEFVIKWREWIDVATAAQ